MFRKILLPVDLSDRHDRALEVAADLATASGGEIMLLHVIEVIGGSNLEEDSVFYERLEKSSRSQLDNLGVSLRQRRVASHGKVLYGNRGREILRHARETGADLIVMTAPRIEPDQLGTGLASLSFKVSLFASCPALLVR